MAMAIGRARTDRATISKPHNDHRRAEGNHRMGADHPTSHDSTDSEEAE